MRKLAFGILFATLATPALAFPARPLVVDQTSPLQDVIAVKGGHGHGHGHAWGRGHAPGRAFGWSRGKKVGWGGHGCPPGLWKQGRC